MINDLFVLKVVISSLPVVFSGIINMLFVKSRILNSFSKPLDKGISLKDGKRIFGDNKTYKGFIGMVVFTSLTMFVIGILCKYSGWLDNMIFFNLAHNSNTQNILYGAIWGFGYVLFELPNSFIKRRLDIKPGGAGNGLLKILFLIYDQMDSVLAGALLILYFYSATVLEVVLIIVIGSLIHYIINVLLYYAKIKKQRG